MRPPRVRVVLGRLPEQSADAIVRVCGARLAGSRPDELVKAAGPALADTLRRLQSRGESASDEHAVVTTAGALPARWLIHVRVPMFRPASSDEHLLSRATRSVLAAADLVGAGSIAMPVLGTTGPYWPLDDAIRVCSGTLVTTPTAVTEIRLVVPTPAALERVAEALTREPGR